MYEKPYIVTGNIEPTGSEQAPTDIWQKIELSERGKPQNMNMVQTKKISCLICGESGATVPMKQ